MLKGAAHITGGGITENTPRILPKGLGARIDLARVAVPAVFQWLAGEGGIEESEMLRTFNCGIGMIVVASPEKADAVVKAFARAGETVVMLGDITSARADTSVAYDGKLNLG